jgi:hypothetical protein
MSSDDETERAEEVSVNLLPILAKSDLDFRKNGTRFDFF